MKAIIWFVFIVIAIGLFALLSEQAATQESGEALLKSFNTNSRNSP